MIKEEEQHKTQKHSNKIDSIDRMQPTYFSSLVYYLHP